MASQDVNLANKYQQKTDKQHILDNPDTYIGSVENVDAFVWLLNQLGERIVEKILFSSPASSSSLMREL